MDVPAYIFLGIWFLQQLVSGLILRTTDASDIAWFAHIGGFILGAGIAFFKKELEPAEARS